MGRVDHKARGEKHKAAIAINIELTENQVTELKRREVALLKELEKTTVTDEQVMTLLEFGRHVRNDWGVISQDFASRRALIEKLDIRVTLYKDENGRKKARVRGKITPQEEILDLDQPDLSNDAHTTNCKKDVKTSLN